MRNGVIRKKRLKAERMVDDFMRMPQRIVLGSMFDANLEAINRESRLWVVPS